MIALQSELQQRHGVNVKFSSFDFAAPDLHSRAHAVLSSAVGIDRISVLVNNVGYLSDIPEPFLDHPPGYVDRLITVRSSKNCLFSFFADMYMQVNISAMQEMTRLIMPSMCKRGGCCIINVSSLSAMLTVPLMTVYSASKAYVTTFTSALAAESDNVCIMSIEPGTANTDMCHNKHGGIDNPHPSAVAKGALDYAGTGLTTFTPYWLHQAPTPRDRHRQQSPHVAHTPRSCKGSD